MWVMEAKRVMEAMKVTETLRFMEATKVGGGPAQEVLQLSKSPLTYESSKWARPLSTCLRVFKKYLFSKMGTAEVVSEQGNKFKTC